MTTTLDEAQRRRLDELHVAVTKLVHETNVLASRVEQLERVVATNPKAPTLDPRVLVCSNCLAETARDASSGVTLIPSGHVLRSDGTFDCPYKCQS